MDSPGCYISFPTNLDIIVSTPPGKTNSEEEKIGYEEKTADI